MLLITLFIFALRVTDMSLDTLRLVFVMRGRRLLAGAVGFCQSLIFVTAITTVIRNLDNVYNMIGYAAGFGCGVMLGMAIEERLALGFGHVRVISSTRGRAVAVALREAGYAATELAGHGRDGTVSVVNCTVQRKDVPKVEAIATNADPHCFVTVDDVRSLRRGYWRA